MINKSLISKVTLLYTIFIFLVWTFFTFFTYFQTNTSNKDCNFNFKDQMECINILFGFYNIFHTFNYFRMVYLYSEYENTRMPEIKEIYNYITKIFLFLQLPLLFNCGISFYITVKSEYLSGNYTECSKYEANVLFYISFYSLSILFIIFLSISCIILLIFFFKFVFKLIKDSCSGTNVIKSSNEKETQTDQEIIIPIRSYENDKSNIICIVCMDNPIDIILNPCGHMCLCNSCFLKMESKKCPCCNFLIKEKKAVFLANIYKKN